MVQIAVVERLAAEILPVLLPEYQGALQDLLLDIPLETPLETPDLQVPPVFLESLRQVPALEKIPYVIAPFNV